MLCFVFAVNSLFCNSRDGFFVNVYHSTAYIGTLITQSNFVLVWLMMSLLCHTFLKP